MIRQATVADIPALLSSAGFSTQMQSAYLPGPRFVGYHYWGQATAQISGAVLHRLHRRRDRAVAGADDHRQRRVGGGEVLLHAILQE